MFYAKILIDESAGGPSCMQILPEELNDPSRDITSEVVQCMMVDDSSGCSMIRVNDPGRCLLERLRDGETGENERGRYNITRISNTQYMANVVNFECIVARIVARNECFIVSGERNNDGRICWTVSGMDTVAIRSLVADLRANGIEVERVATYMPSFTPSLTVKQENAIRLALSRGYYEIPRKVSINDLCRETGTSSSSFDVVLRTAERKIISQFMQDRRGSASERKR